MFDTEDSFKDGLFEVDEVEGGSGVGVETRDSLGRFEGVGGSEEGVPGSCSFNDDFGGRLGGRMADMVQVGVS